MSTKRANLIIFWIFFVFGSFVWTNTSVAIVNERLFDSVLRNNEGDLIHGERSVVFNVFSDRGVEQEWNFNKQINFDRGSFRLPIPNVFFDGKHYLIVTINGDKARSIQRKIELPKEMITVPEYVGIIFGVSFILFFAIMKFNTWPDDKNIEYDLPPRYFTTFTRYMTYCSIYIIFTELFFLMIIFLPDFFISLNLSMDVPKDMPLLRDIKKNLVLWSLFLVTGVLPVFPWINRFELNIRRALHKMAFIPRQAKSAILEFNDNPLRFKADPVIVDKILAEDNGKHEKYDFLKQDDGNSHKWCKIRYLLFQISNWDKKERFEDKAQMSTIMTQKFNSEYNQLEEDISKYQQILSSEIAKEDIKDYKAWLNKRISQSINKLLDKLYTHLSCNILSTQKTPQKRIESYKHFGLYPKKSEKVYFHIDTIIKTIFFILLSVLVPCMVIGVSKEYLGFQSDTLKDGKDILLWALFGVSMHGFTILASSAILRYLHSHQFADNANIIAIRTLSAITGYVIGFLIILGGKFIDPQNVQISTTENFLWPFITCVTGFFIAYHIDTTIPKKRDIFHSAILQAVVTSVVAITTCFLLDKQDIVLYNATVTICFFIGYSIGYTYAHGYRNRERLNLIAQDRGRSMDRIKCNLPINIVEDGAKIPYQVLDINVNGVKINRPLKKTIGQKFDIIFDSSLKVTGELIRKTKDCAVLKILGNNRQKGRIIQTFIDQNA